MHLPVIRPSGIFISFRARRPTVFANFLRLFQLKSVPPTIRPSLVFQGLEGRGSTYMISKSSIHQQQFLIYSTIAPDGYEFTKSKEILHDIIIITNIKTSICILFFTAKFHCLIFLRDLSKKSFILKDLGKSSRLLWLSSHCIHYSQESLGSSWFGKL